MTMHNATAAASLAPSAVIERAQLAFAFETVKLATEKRNSLPILATARITGDGTSAIVTATDCDLEISVTIPGAVDSRLAMCLDVHKFADLLKKAPAADMVALSQPGAGSPAANGDPTFDGKATADFERVTYKLPAIHPCNWPPLQAPDASTSAHLDIPGAVARDSFAAVAGAISTEETRYYLNGVYMHRPDNGAGRASPLTLVATDGHRLYRQTVAAGDVLQNPDSFLPGVILPRKLVAILGKLWKGKACPESVAFTVAENRVAIEWGAVRIVAKTIDGTFPEYQRVIPSHNGNVARIGGAALTEGIKAVATISDEKGRAVRCTWDAGNVALSMQSPDAGSAHTDVACTYDGDGIEIGFNARYLIDLVAVAGESVSVAMGDAGSPALITGDRDGWTGVLMPVRV